MNKGLAVVIGMTIAYAASLLGMIFAYISYKKHKGSKVGENTKERGEIGDV